MLGVILLSTAVAAATPNAPAFIQSRGAIPEPARPRCERVVRPIAAGAYITTGDVAAADCGANAAARAFRYDRTAMAARATRDLSRGDLVPALPSFALPAVVPGQTIVLEARIGGVELTRSVSALQAANPGRKLFVQSSDGEVFAVDFPAELP